MPGAVDDEIIQRIQHWLEILDDASYYEVLGVLEIESDEGIRDAFHRFSQSFHPDLHRDAPAEVREAVTQIYKRGVEAYGTLRDERRRSAYDVGLAQGNLRHFREMPSDPLHKLLSLSLVERARSKAAQLHCRQAERAIAESRFDDAEKLVEKASLADDGNPELEQTARALIERRRRGEFLPSQ